MNWAAVIEDLRKTSVWHSEVSRDPSRAIQVAQVAATVSGVLGAMADALDKGQRVPPKAEAK